MAGISQAQNVGINTTGAAGHPSAMLDISATDKGVLFPNVTLTGATDGTTIPSPAKGLVVWNTGTSWGIAGLYYNDGTTGAPGWVKMTTGAFSAGTGIGLTGGVISNTGVLSLAGTTNRITVSSATGNITLSTPQDIHTGANPTFNSVTAPNDFFGRINIEDTRNTNAATNTYSREVHFEFKDRSVIGAPGAGTFGGLMTIAPWADNSGNNHHQLYFNDGGIFYRSGLYGSAWNGWSQVMTENQISGTTNYMAKFTSANTLGNSQVFDNGTNVGIGTNAPASKLQVIGSVFIPSGQSYWIGNNGDSGDRLRLHHTGTNAYIDYATGDLNFRAGTAAKFILQNDGDVQAINLAGTGNRPVYADASGVLNTGVPVYKVASSLHPSNDDITWGTTIRNTCADDAVATVTWGFNFMINGTAYTGGWLSTNGVLGFGSASTTSYSNSELPTSVSTDPMLFFHWDDDGSNLQRYVVLGNAPNRICYIHSRQSEATGCTGGASQVDVYITLHETSNLISVRYLGIGSAADVQGAGATYGFQFAGGSAAYSVPLGYNAKLLDDNNGNQSFSIDLGK